MPASLTTAKATQDNWRHGVLHLVSWPNLAELPVETVAHVARVCALLARRPSTCVLISFRLNMSLHTTNVLLDTLHSQGHVALLGAQADPQAAGAAGEGLGGDLNDPMPGSFLGRLWQRLVGRK